MGCRWLTQDPDDEIVPNRSTVDVPELSVDSRPAFDWRLFKASQPHLAPWGLKRGMNSFFPPATAAGNGGSLFLPAQASGVHTFSKMIPASKYFTEHPDWFWLMISIILMLLIADHALNLGESVIEIMRTFVESQD